MQTAPQDRLSAAERNKTMAPRVLIADKLSPAAVEIFRARGVDADVKTGLSKDELLKIVGDYDGLAVRSATKADKDVIAAATNMKAEKPATQFDIPARNHGILPPPRK